MNAAKPQKLYLARIYAPLMNHPGTTGYRTERALSDEILLMATGSRAAIRAVDEGMTEENLSNYNLYAFEASAVSKKKAIEAIERGVRNWTDL